MNTSTHGPGDGRYTSAHLGIVDQSLTIALTGSLTSESVPMVRLHLLTLTTAWGPTELLLDLSGVHTIDVPGARPLLEARRLQSGRGAILRLVAVSPVVMEFFQGQPRFARLLVPPGHDAPAAAGLSNVTQISDLTVPRSRRRRTRRASRPKVRTPLHALPWPAEETGQAHGPE